jgi:hypothetical protein
LLIITESMRPFCLRCAKTSALAQVGFAPRLVDLRVVGVDRVRLAGEVLGHH